MKPLAGSNTVKGTINEGMDVELALQLGKIIGRAYGSPVAVAMDGRTSNVMLKTALASGIMSVGCDVYDLGAVPTPIIQYYMALHPEVNGGVAITASFAGQDINGFKVMKTGGLDDSIFYDYTIESIMAEEIPGVPGLQVGEIYKVEDFIDGYIESILSPLMVTQSTLSLIRMSFTMGITATLRQSRQILMLAFLMASVSTRDRMDSMYPSMKSSTL